TLAFDDGFRGSSLKTAEIFEKARLRAGFNVIATGGRADFVPPDAWHNAPRGDFGLWNELRARGHEIMPHGLRHAAKSRLPLGEAQDLIRRCLNVFDAELVGFDRKSAIFNFPYNASTPQLNAWVATQVRASRSEGPRGAFGIN